MEDGATDDLSCAALLSVLFLLFLLTAPRMAIEPIGAILFFLFTVHCS